MTEEEQLKKNTEQQKAEQLYKEVNAYVDELSERILYTMRRDLEAWFIYLAAWVIWVSSNFWAPGLENTFNMIFFVALIYQFYRTNERIAASAEFRGAIKMLRLLGMIPPRGERNANKVHFWVEGKEMIKAWMTKKEKVQKEAFA